MAELDAGRWNGERDVEAIVDEQLRRKDGKTEREVVVFQTGQLTAPGMQSQIAAAAFGECARDHVYIGPPRDALIGDRVQARQWLSHVNFAPASRRAPRSQSFAAIRSLPAGCTSKISIVPPPVAITSDSPAERT